MEQIKKRFDMTLLLTLFFVLNLSVAHAETVGFRSFLSTPQKNVPNQVYTLIKFQKLAFDSSKQYDRKKYAWYPPTGIVTMSGQVMVVDANTEGIPQNPSYVVKVVKNAIIKADGTIYGADVCTGLGAQSGMPGMVKIQFSCTDIAIKGDYYQATISVSGKNGGVSYLDGNPAHTFWWGRN